MIQYEIATTIGSGLDAFGRGSSLVFGVEFLPLRRGLVVAVRERSILHGKMSILQGAFYMVSTLQNLGTHTAPPRMLQVVLQQNILYCSTTVGVNYSCTFRVYANASISDVF